ncbi:hypothetical protein GF373_04730, partial [bacterium]|nr:hypothetical protein [bacterium]
ANVISQFYHSTASPLIYQATTDSEGTFSFTNLPVGMYKLSVDTYEGYITGDWSQFAKYGVETPTNLTQYIDQDIHNYIIRLSPCWKVKGTVRDPYKKALPDVPIHLRLVYTPSVRGDFMGSRQFDRSTVTDESGNYGIFGDYMVRGKDAYAGVQAIHKWYGRKSHKFIPEPGKTYEIDFSFNQKPNLKGKVFDPNRNPIHQARVVIYTTNKGFNSDKISSHGDAYTNKQGEYRIHAKEGDYFLDVRARGYVMKPEDESTMIHIQTERVKTKNLVMDYGSNLIGGTVQTSDGEPLEDVSIYIEHYNDQRNITISTNTLDPVSQTDRHGEFSYDLTGLKLRPILSPKYKLAAVPPKNSGYETAYLDNIQAGDTSIHIILEVKEDKSGTIYGRVLSANELPVRQFDLLLKPSLSSFFDSDNKDHFQFRWHSYFAGDGTFCLKSIPSDFSPFTIVAMSEDHGLTISNEFSLMPNQVQRDLVVQFTQKTQVTGRVVFQNNSEPLPGAEITFQFFDDPIEQHQVYTRKMVRGLQFWNYSPDQSHVIPFLPHASTNENGKFIVNNLPSKTLMMTIRKKRYRTAMHIVDCSKSSHLELGTIPMKLNRR